MDRLSTLFLNEHGSYSKNVQFEVILLFVLCMFIITFLFPTNYGFVVILICFVYYVGNVYVNIRQSTLSDFNKLTFIQLQDLQTWMNNYITKTFNKISNERLKYSPKQLQQAFKDNELDSFYIDANMINFIYSNKNLAAYNEQEFFSFVKGTNNILKIKKDISDFYDANNDYPQNIAELLEIAVDMRGNTLNNLHNFIYTIPKQNAVNDYLDAVVNRYQVLISRNTDDIYSAYLHYNKLHDINNSTKIVSYNTTKPYNRSTNHPITPSKQPTELQMFYL